MNQPELNTQVTAFNYFLRERPWLDIDLVECSSHAVVLHCGIDLSAGPDVEVKFEQVFFVSSLMTWKTDTSVPILRILTGNAAVQLNVMYRIEMGYHLFAFQPEDLDELAQSVIAARTFSWREMVRN